MRKVIFPLLAAFAAATVIGCETATPNSAANRTAVRDDAHVALDKMFAQDPGLRDLTNNAYGYVVFPNVGKAAVAVGGAQGHGVVYHNGQQIGTVKMDQASIGPQVGGETYSELIVFQDEKAFNRLTNDSLSFGANAAATLVKAGASASGQFENGVRVFKLANGGFIVGADINGQKFFFHRDNAGGQ